MNNMLLPLEYQIGGLEIMNFLIDSCDFGQLEENELTKQY